MNSVPAAFETDVVVIGAGVVGLACAATLAAHGREVLVLERNGGIGEETSSRNSEVIHAGIYYPPGSAKARLCVEGKALLYRYCAERQIAYRRIGKLVVATNADEEQAIRKLMQQGEANGVDDLRWLTADQVRLVEPALNCVGAMHSPSTGIVDSHGLMLSLLGELEEADGLIALHSRVTDIQRRDNRFAVVVETEQEKSVLVARTVINCAGLGAVEMARKVAPNDRLPTPHYTKGNYFKLRGRSPFSTLIYPAPVPGGLGVHLTLDLAGNARFGPDVEPVDTANPDPLVDPARGNRFYQSIRRYWPDLPDGALQTDYAGIRPKISWPNDSPAPDFVIQGERDHGVPGLVNCLGIESPGLTSSLAIAEEMVDLAAVGD